MKKMLKYLSKRLHSEENSDILSDEDQSYQNKVSLTPPPIFEISPIVNKHLEQYKKETKRINLLQTTSTTIRTAEAILGGGDYS